MAEIYDRYVAGEGDSWTFDVNNLQHRNEVQAACLKIRNRTPPDHIRVGPYTNEDAHAIYLAEEALQDAHDGQSLEPLGHAMFAQYCRP